ncbi:ATP-binding cassette domain-containing protein [Corticicoccus populi]|uniref:UvrABC system protein A n=1 Tax=Corticicoccus populi TaxID=1812821 RepID=A0ABW5WWG0_9STAP
MAKNYADYQMKSFHALLKHLNIPVPENMTLENFNDNQFDVFRHGIHSSYITEEERTKLPSKVADGKYDGVEPKIWIKIAEAKSIPDNLSDYVKEDTCPDCSGEKLNPVSRAATVHGYTLPYISEKSLKYVYEWAEQIKLSGGTPGELVKDYLLDIETKTKRISKLGLDYLSLDRQYSTLSGGEAQRIKLAAVLDSKMTELIIILDEPTAGLHPSDTEGLMSMIEEIKNRKNTVIVIEHDDTFIRSADFIVEIGPKSGMYGGEILSSGTYEEISGNPESLFTRSLLPSYHRTSCNRPTDIEAVQVHGAEKHNLKEISLSLPAHCLSVITGVSGSGKSSLLFKEIAESQLKDNRFIEWKTPFKDLALITQTRPVRNKRSIVATYLDVFDDIRKLFAKKARQLNAPFTASDFSFNSGSGRCPECQGLGEIENNQLFFENIQLQCSSCFGSRYKSQILDVKVDGNSISDVLNFSIEEALKFFHKHQLNAEPLQLLSKTNLGYITLGQTTDTLSGGEMQRLRLTRVISKESGRNVLFILDEPTVGMHKIDVFHFMELIHQLIDAGNTFFFIEHNTDVIRQADYIVELGPGGGDNGGSIVYAGNISNFKDSATKTSEYL